MALYGAGLVFVGGMIGGRYVMGKINAVQEEEDNAPKVVFVLGGPGSGKGTNCERIVEDFGFVHLSAGDLLRAERKSGSGLGSLIESLISQGRIVPSEITVKLLKNAMEKEKGSGATKFLIDGFPRNQENLDVWNRDMVEYAVQFVLNLDCPEAVMEERLLARGQTSGRSDDNADAIRTRFKVHVESTVPVVEHFRKVGKLVTVASGRHKDAVYADVRRAFMPPGQPVKYGFYDGKQAPAQAPAYMSGGKDVDDADALEGGAAPESADAPVLFNIYEAPDGFRGTYDEVLAYEKKMGFTTGQEKAGAGGAAAPAAAEAAAAATAAAAEAAAAAKAAEEVAAREAAAAKAAAKAARDAELAEAARVEAELQAAEDARPWYKLW